MEICQEYLLNSNNHYSTRYLARFMVNARYCGLDLVTGFIILLFATVVKSDLAKNVQEHFWGCHLETMKCNFGRKTKKHVSVFVLEAAVQEEFCTYQKEGRCIEY